MSKQLLFALGVECWLVLLTSLMLTQPSFVFGPRSDDFRRMVTTLGLFLLCMTFCWSVVFGGILAFHRLNQWV